MKILDRESIKWWGKQKEETWAYKQGKDWWIIKPKRKIEPVSLRKEKIEPKEEVNWSRIWVASLAGAVLGVGVFSLLITYLLLKNAL